VLLLSLPNITTAIATTQTMTLETVGGPPCDLLLQCAFVFGSGGTAVDVWVQTSVDGGRYGWCDIANFHFANTSASPIINLTSTTPITSPVTPTDAGLDANTCIDGLLSNFIRVKYRSTGTFSAGTSLNLYGICSHRLVPFHTPPWFTFGLTTASPAISSPAVSPN
jgi:hypothetical protein